MYNVYCSTFVFPGVPPSPSQRVCVQCALYDAETHVNCHLTGFVLTGILYHVVLVFYALLI